MQINKAEQATEKIQGHWLLAKMVKRVLHSGGLELTEKMITHLNIHCEDRGWNLPWG